MNGCHAVMSELSSSRGFNYVYQVKSSFIFKGLAILATFVAMPITIKYLGNELFGVWATMLALISWVMLFDLGIGNGLRNKVSESLSASDYNSAREYVAASYMVVGFVAVVLFLVVLIVSISVSWQRIFNTTIVSEVALRESVIVLAMCILANFWISLVAQVFHGLQKTSYVVFSQFLANILALFSVYALYVFCDSSILYMVLAYGLALVSSNLILTLILHAKHPRLMPFFSKPKLLQIKPLLTLGIQFFIIQLATLSIYMTDRIIISQILGPGMVTPYEVVLKLFSFFVLIQTLLLTPLLPAYTEAFHRGDYSWIKKYTAAQLVVFLVLSLSALIFSFNADWLIQLWVGDGVDVPRYVVGLFVVLTIMMLWNAIFSCFIGAIGKLKIGVFITSFSAAINIPLSIYLAQTDLGVAGVILATIISISLTAIISPLQYLFYVRKGSVYVR
ncbi:MAG: polysaccharide biosynthesis protein [Gammaproteobacteria bacterium]|nr:polysaccharide biosynthesis protein [Gammaproteobacteria bacterium]